MSERTIIVRTRPDGTVWQVHPDGTETRRELPPIPAMTEAEIEAAAQADPDARPMTEAEWRAAPKTPRAKIIRHALRLTQEEFSARYHIPLGILCDWEQGRTQPDQTALAYLRAIAGDAEAVWRALEKAGEHARSAAE